MFFWYTQRMTDEKTEQIIRTCQAEAAISIEGGTLPFGCVITNADGNIIARDHNTQQIAQGRKTRPTTK